MTKGSGTMPQTHTLNWATPTDTDALADIVFDAVRNGPSRYTITQRAAWVPMRRQGEEWVERLKGQVIAIARDETRAVGFMSLAAQGYIDFAFIRPEAQGTGLFRRLFDMIEELALSQKEPRLWVHASLMAEPAFAAVGFAVVEREVVEVDDEGLERAKMEKLSTV
jgi:putative acetyltransferase